MLLERAESGDTAALDEMMPLVYEQLRGIARSVLGGEASGHTLQPTALVNVAYVKLAGASTLARGRQHFYAIAAKAMRQILADHARGKRRQKRGGDWHRVTLIDRAESREVDTADLDAALTELGEARPECAQVVELRYFGGLTMDEIADTMGVSTSSAHNHWRTARAWLRVRLAED